MMGDEEFLRRFRDCTLAPAQFDHRGHARVGRLYL